MKLLILLWLLNSIIFGNSGTAPCLTPDCGEKEFGMKDVNFKIDFNLGEISTKSKTDCSGPPAPEHNCYEVFKAINNSVVIETNMDPWLLNDLDAKEGDSVHCKVDEIQTSTNSALGSQMGFDIYTSPDKSVYMTAPESKCLSFHIKAKNNAKIILSNSITTTDRIEIVLGSYNNTKISYQKMRINCEHNIDQSWLLDEYEFVNFWLCWKSGRAILGKDREVIISETENIEINEQINFIGLETTHSASGTWKIFESYCPGCHEGKPEDYVKVSCGKVEDTCTRPSSGPKY